VGQDREGPAAQATKSTPNADVVMLVIVCSPEPLPVTNDCVGLTNRTPTAAGDPMELPRIAVVFRFWQCDNENQAGVKRRY
jgi:hypothetical protein